MEEIRCPMCGKPNPNHLEICEHCQARLKPLIISSDEDLPGESIDSDAGLPDWLRSDQQDAPISDSEFEAQDSPEDDSDDDAWLNKLREEGDSTPIDISALEDSAASEEPDEEDWLDRIKDLRDADAEPQDAEPQDNVDTPMEDNSSSIFDGALPSWMSADDDEAGSEEPAQEDDSSIFDGALPSWMSEKEETEIDQVKPQEEVVPRDEAVPKESGSSIPDWLAVSDEQAEQLDEEVELDASELPEWLFGSDTEAPETAVEEESPLPSSLETAPLEKPVVGNVPDWLTNATESPDDVPLSNQLTDEELPDWMKEPSAAEAEPAPSIAESTPDPDTELPDWMVEQADDTDAQPAAESIEGKIPDWLLTADDAESPSSSTEESSADGIPDWMSGEEDEEAQVSTILAEPDPEEPDWISGLETEDIDWPIPDAETPGGDLEPDWLESIGDENIPELTSNDLAPTGDDLFKIDRLTELLKDEDALQIPEPMGEEQDGLAPADLPGWLEAMRPVESSAEGDSTVEQGPTEQTGPLAGLSGVLMAEPEIARLKQAPKLSSRLQVSETQQEHVKVFRELLETEGQAVKHAKPMVVSSQGLLRWLSAFFLIFVIGLVIIGETQFVPSPLQSSVPVEVFNTSSLINTLAPKDPVLVSFDFEPGTSGEMNAAAAAVVDHLMIRGAYLTLISTSPTGPALAEYFISTVQEDHQYTSGNQYVNLGYIPGGASGLLGFVQMPQRIKPLSFDGFDPWITEPLDGIYALSDFKMILVITDNPDIAQSWIEQVEPRIQDTPLVAVVSAQAEPILQPFVGGEDAQVRGMVSGVIGGTAYEQVTGKDNLGRTYWDALNFSLMTAIAAILIGGIVNVFSILLRGRRRGGNQ